MKGLLIKGRGLGIAPNANPWSRPSPMPTGPGGRRLVLPYRLHFNALGRHGNHMGPPGALYGPLAVLLDTEPDRRLAVTMADLQRLAPGHEVLGAELRASVPAVVWAGRPLLEWQASHLRAHAQGTTVWLLDNREHIVIEPSQSGATHAGQVLVIPIVSAALDSDPRSTSTTHQATHVPTQLD